MSVKLLSITVDIAVIQIKYNFDAEVKLSSTAVGDTAKAKIWFNFFVDNMKEEKVIVDTDLLSSQHNFG